MSRKISSQITIQPLTPEQRKWGLRGALEALDNLLSGGVVNEKRVKELHKQVTDNLSEVDKEQG